MIERRRVARPRLLGLLDLEPLAHGGFVTLRSAPSADAPLLRRVHSMDEIPYCEATYEFPAAILVDRREGGSASASTIRRTPRRPG